MIPELTPIERCAEMAGLRSYEIVLGVSPSDKHQRMLARYRRNLSVDAARRRLVADIRNAVKIGAPRRAADLLIVLRWLLSSDASCDGTRATSRPRRRVLSAGRRRSATPSSATEMKAVGGGDVVYLFDGGRRRG
ncbi:polysaccharide deacetylase [Methylocystis sp. B8]|uniref:polysaccharide deacetylase n=1 Tax=Methylocystis sp. B8 TaxID=544938 RepID=UPI0010FD1EA0|nr:polysaccharide deacetylase [Methylocystis sp. B8]TLG79181.1 polysaccharide deacetylase [Methylocystis sp. B8]